MIKLFAMNYSLRSDNYVVVSDLRADGSLRPNHLRAVNISKKKPTHFCYCTSYIMKQKYWRPSEAIRAALTAEAKRCYSSLIPQTAFPSESAGPRIAFSRFRASWDALLGEAQHKNSPFADEHQEAPALLLISGSQGLQTVQSCFSACCSHRAIWQPSGYLPAIALAGVAQKAGREEKAVPRAFSPAREVGGKLISPHVCKQGFWVS